jgi:hypothetical protein
MSKIVFITNNSEKIRNKLKESGFSICDCAYFPDSVWLDYHPDENCFTFDIHGEGYCDEGDWEEKYSPLKRIQMRLKESDYYSEEREFYSTVEEFLKVYSKKIKVVSDQPLE